MISPIFFYKQKDMFEYANQNNHSFFFTKDLDKNGTKCYSSFSNSHQFVEYYLSIPNQDKHLNELIRTDTPFYEFYDLDLKLPNEYDISIYNNEDLFIWFDNIRYEFLQSLQITSVDNFKPKWIITTASNKNKLSLHILNSNTIFTSHSAFKHYYSLLKTYIENFVNTNHPFYKAIDFSVCSNNRCMRLCLSTKIDSDRTLKIYKNDDLNHIISLSKNPSLIDTFITNAINDPLISSKSVKDEDFKDTNDTNDIKEEKSSKDNLFSLTNIRIDHSNDLLKNLLSILSKDRSDSYDTWIKIGMALKNLNENLFDLWDQWSKQSTKYSSAIKTVWDKFVINHTNPITIGSIHFLAKQDNPEKYKELISQYSYKKIDIPFTPSQTINHKYIPSQIYTDNFNINNY